MPHSHRIFVVSWRWCWNCHGCRHVQPFSASAPRQPVQSFQPRSLRGSRGIWGLLQKSWEIPGRSFWQQFPRTLYWSLLTLTWGYLRIQSQDLEAMVKNPCKSAVQKSPGSWNRVEQCVEHIHVWPSRCMNIFVHSKFCSGKDGFALQFASSSMKVPICAEMPGVFVCKERWWEYE